MKVIDAAKLLKELRKIEVDNRSTDPESTPRTGIEIWELIKCIVKSTVTISTCGGPNQ